MKPKATKKGLMRCTSVWLPPEMSDALRKLQIETGIPMTEAIRRALEAYLKEKGVMK